MISLSLSVLNFWCYCNSLFEQKDIFLSCYSQIWYSGATMYINKFWYLHGKDRATVISCYFAYLENLAVAAFPNNFAQLEILRPDLLAFAVDILLAYRHRFYASHFGIVGRTVKKIKKFSLTTNILRSEEAPRDGPRGFARRETHTHACPRAREALTHFAISHGSASPSSCKRKTDAALKAFTCNRQRYWSEEGDGGSGFSVGEIPREPRGITVPNSMTSSSSDSSLCSSPASCSSKSKIADIADSAINRLM